MALKQTFICPFCFEEHKISDIQENRHLKQRQKDLQSRNPQNVRSVEAALMQ